MASLYFRFDSQYDIYERRIYSFGELLGQIGGLFQIFLMIGVSIVSIFSERLFVSSILRKIYQIDQTREDDIKSNKKILHNLPCINENCNRVFEKPKQNHSEDINSMLLFRKYKIVLYSYLHLIKYNLTYFYMKATETTNNNRRDVLFVLIRIIIFILAISKAYYNSIY